MIYKDKMTLNGRISQKFYVLKVKTISETRLILKIEIISKTKSSKLTNFKSEIRKNILFFERTSYITIYD